MQEFDQLVGQGNIVIADFYADWCGPCQALIPTLNILAKELEGRADIVKVNVDDHQELASRFGIRTIPTIIYFQNQNNFKLEEWLFWRNFKEKDLEPN